MIIDFQHENQICCPYNNLSIANWFVKKGLETNQKLTVLRLIRLVYLAQGWFLGLNLTRTTDKYPSLIDSTIEAWSFGPVVNDIYQYFKYKKNNSIDDLAKFVKCFRKDKSSELEYIPIVPNSDEVVTALLIKVWQVYSSYTNNQLSALCCGVDSPWYKIWHNGGKYIKYTDIPNKDIKQYFEILLKKT